MSQLMISPQCEDQNSIICFCHGPGFWPNILIILYFLIELQYGGKEAPIHIKKELLCREEYVRERNLSSFLLLSFSTLLHLEYVLHCKNNVAYCPSLVLQSPSPLPFRLQDQKLSITVSLLKNLCELIEPCSPDIKFHFNIQITKLS